MVVFRCGACGAKEARRMSAQFVEFSYEEFINLEDCNAFSRVKTDTLYIETIPAPEPRLWI